MRTVTQNAVNCFYNKENGNFSNTSVITEGNITKMFLHGNLIAKIENDKLFITNACWKSKTTKERLNGLKGVNIFQKKGEWFLNGEKWNGKLTEISQ